MCVYCQIPLLFRNITPNFSIFSLLPIFIFETIAKKACFVLTGMAVMAKEVGEECNKILVALHKDLLASLDLSPLRGKISELSALGNAIQTGESPESLGDLVENELAQMDKAIEEAALKMEVQSEYIFIFLYDFLLKNPSSLRSLEDIMHRLQSKVLGKRWVLPPTKNFLKSKYFI